MLIGRLKAKIKVKSYQEEVNTRGMEGEANERYTGRTGSRTGAVHL